MPTTKNAPSLDDLLTEAYAEEDLTREDILDDKGVLSTGNLAFDFKLGGGLPRGRTAEFYGLSQSAKTTAALEAAVQAQRNGEVVVYIDFEQALDTKYMKKLGLDTDDRSTFKPYPASTLEKGMSFARRAVRTGEVGIIIFDSVAAMVPESSAAADSDSRTLAMERARLLGAACGALNPLLARTGTIAIFINHERDVIDTSGMPQRGPKRTTTAGGTALKFYASVRVQFKVVKKFPSEVLDPVSGEKIKKNHSQLSHVTITKNKVDTPDQATDIYVEFGKGFSNAWSAMSVLIANKVCSKSGAFYRFPEHLYHPQMSLAKNGKDGQMQGMAAVLALAEFDPAWEDRLVAAARALLGAVVPTEIGPSLEDDGEDPETPDEVSDIDDGVATAAFAPRRARAGDAGVAESVASAEPGLSANPGSGAPVPRDEGSNLTQIPESDSDATSPAPAPASAPVEPPRSAPGGIQFVTAP